MVAEFWSFHIVYNLHLDINYHDYHNQIILQLSLMPALVPLLSNYFSGDDDNPVDSI